MFLVKKPPENVCVLGFGLSEDYPLDGMSHCGKPRGGGDTSGYVQRHKMLSGPGPLTKPTLSLPNASSVSESLRRVLVHCRERMSQADLQPSTLAAVPAPGHCCSKPAAAPVCAQVFCWLGCFQSLRQGLTLQLRLAWNTLCGPGWPQIHGDPPASASHVLV